MLDLYDEFKAIIAALTEHKIDYAVCGGLAMAVYGLTRATVDIDLMIARDDFERVKEAVQPLGYIIEAPPMMFAKRAVEIRRLSKLDADSGDLLMLECLLVTPQIEEAWNSRIESAWEDGTLRVVSRAGLIALKSLRASAQDVEDIKRLKDEYES